MKNFWNTEKCSQKYQCILLLLLLRVVVLFLFFDSQCITGVIKQNRYRDNFKEDKTKPSSAQGAGCNNQASSQIVD